MFNYIYVYHKHFNRGLNFLKTAFSITDFSPQMNTSPTDIIFSVELAHCPENRFKKLPRHFYSTTINIPTLYNKHTLITPICFNKL